MAASPKEFREFAQECLRWADETKKAAPSDARFTARW
jgi:hypothetical protein